MIFRKYQEFLGAHRIDENLKAARQYLGVTTVQAAEKDMSDGREEMDKLAKEVVRLSKEGDIDAARAARARKAELDAQLKDKVGKAKVLEEITRQLGQQKNGWIYAFTKFFFECFPETIDDDARMEALLGRGKDVKSLAENLEDLDRTRMLSELPLVKSNSNNVPAALTAYADLAPAVAPTGRVMNGLETLVDDIDKARTQRSVRNFIKELPGAFTVTNKFAKDFGESVQSFRDAAKNATGRQRDQIRDIAVSFEELSDNPADRHALQRVFFWGCKRYRTLSELITKAEAYIKSSSIADVAGLLIQIYKANEQFGFPNGATIVYEKDEVVVFEVKSFQANQLINSKTKHCIKDHYYHWEHYVGPNDESKNNKQYFIWDFNVSPTNSRHIIGVTVMPGFKVFAAHEKQDENVTETIKGYIEKHLGIKFNEVFLPMDETDIQAKKRRIVANKTILETDLSVEKAKVSIEDGADPNCKSGVPLENAVKAKNYALAEYLITVGAKATIGKPMDHASSLDMIVLLKKNGAEVTDNVIERLVLDPKAIKYLIEEGNLDPNGPYGDDGPEAVAVRYAIRAGRKVPANVGASGLANAEDLALESLKLLIDAGGEVQLRGYLAVRQAYEGGCLKIAKYLIDHMKSKNMSIDKEQYFKIIKRLETASKLRDNAKKKKVQAQAAEDLKKVTAGEFTQEENKKVKELLGAK